jgi:broad specificity phosphatase PhoE
MKLILVRHGETEWNARHINQGRIDIPLNKKGREQARKVAIRLRSEQIDIIYSSNLKRAKHTAIEAAKFHKAPVRYSNLITERKFGKLEGMLREEYKKIVEKSGIPKYLYRPPGGGENYMDIQKRVKKFLAMIKKKHANETVLVVSHQGIIRTFITILTKKPIHTVYEIEQNTAGVSVIELKRGSPPKIHYLNSTEHL